MANTEAPPQDPTRRSWYDILTPFSPSALALLPKLARPRRYTRADAIPEVEDGQDGQRPTVRDYHAINSLPPRVRVPKKVATTIRVEGKVWFANERSEYFHSQILEFSSLKLSSLGFVAEYSNSYRDSRSCTIQRLRGSGGDQLCHFLCYG
jgi:hypothetical protein